MDVAFAVFSQKHCTSFVPNVRLVGCDRKAQTSHAYSLPDEEFSAETQS
jgi:hypothetical protein